MLTNIALWYELLSAQREIIVLRKTLGYSTRIATYGIASVATVVGLSNSNSADAQAVLMTALIAVVFGLWIETSNAANDSL
ncbi:hypothetical protein [Veronia nyctiphanis]|uniref:hypothetical protein n=1 Tax=Veronia nyctiphanis TaxID=1278244 RepID=UPI0011AEB4AD|nr:hypothetical protein [Veronia nyctiphanis]